LPNTVRSGSVDALFHDKDFSELAWRAELPAHFTITTIEADQSLLKTEID
jgi:hypothetical protein